MVVDTEPILASGPRALYYGVIEAAAGFRVSPSVPLLERLYYGIEWVRPSSVQAFGVGHCTTGSVCGLFGASALAIVLRGLSVVWPMLEIRALYYGIHEVRPSSFLGLWCGTGDEVLWMRNQSFVSHLDLIGVVTWSER